MTAPQKVYQLGSARQNDPKRSSSVQRPQFSMNFNSAGKPLASPRNTYRSQKDILGTDGVALVSGANDFAMKNGKAGKSIQSMSLLPSGAQTSSDSTHQQLNDGFASQRTLKTTT